MQDKLIPKCLSGIKLKMTACNFSLSKICGISAWPCSAGPLIVGTAFGLAFTRNPNSKSCPCNTLGTAEKTEQTSWRFLGKDIVYLTSMRKNSKNEQPQCHTQRHLCSISSSPYPHIVIPDFSSRQAVASRLHNVQQLAASNGAFAALLEDGQIVTWGSPYSGGESRGLQERLCPDTTPWKRRRMKSGWESLRALVEG